jgi:hypothetical protein
MATTTQTRVEVSTSAFEFAHGHKARGEGSWAFFFEGETEARWFRGTFTEAKRQAVRAAAAAGVHRVTVGS